MIDDIPRFSFCYSETRTVVGQFTKKLISLMKLVMSREDFKEPTHQGCSPKTNPFYKKEWYNE